MDTNEIHQGGCVCGAVRYQTTGKPERVGVYQCRYCQTRTGSAFGVSVSFKDVNVQKTSGDLNKYEFKTEYGKSFA